MLEYFKVILVKVSFDKGLFEKELRKAISSVMITEIKDLKNWCTLKFGIKYQEILEKCFNRNGYTLTF